jgi:hypothetical protein
MREYDDDDNIRLYAPVLQRVIVLAAVVVAVPVMMWTITTFIRSYVARPQVPTFQHLTLSEAAPIPPPATALAASPPPASAAPAASAAALADTGAGGAPTPSAGASASAAAPATAPSPPPVPVMAGAAVENPAQGGSPTATAPMASPDADGLPTVAKAAGLTGRIATNGSGTTAAAPAWPNPNAGGPPAFGAPQPTGAMTETASTEALPPPRPIKGRVPLPRRRPAAIALAATEDIAPPAAVPDTAPAGTASSEMASTDALPPPQPIKGRVPLPRCRPAVMALATTGSIAPPAPIGRAVPMPKLRPVEAPPDAPPAPVSAPYGYHPGLDSGR